jgi:hypothetical protein
MQAARARYLFCAELFPWVIPDHHIPSALGCGRFYEGRFASRSAKTCLISGSMRSAA